MRCKCLALAAALLLSIGGCASKPMISQWSNPDYTSVARSCHKIIVIGVMDRGAIRNFEDRFVAELRAAGIDAVPSYRVLAEPAKDL